MLAKRRWILLVFSMLAIFQARGQGIPVSGYLLEQESLEPIPFARVYLRGEPSTGTLSNAYGYFSLTISRQAEPLLQVEATGYLRDSILVPDSVGSPMRILLSPQQFATDSVKIVAASQETAPGIHRLSRSFFATIPTFLGERDVVKALQYLPGVQRGNDGNSSLHVRGGNGDQNLILLDEAPVYNVNHLFGFFSVFNGDAVQNVEFIKAGFPAHYGGRLSSVLSVTTREGSREKWGADGAVGITAARLTVGGPVFNRQASVLLSARRTYWDALVRPFNAALDANARPFFFFHDYNAKLAWNPDEKNKLILSAYNSWDRYGVKDLRNSGFERLGFAWRNFTSNLRWNHVFSPRAFSNTSLFTTQYEVKLFNEGRFSRQNEAGRQDISSGSGMLDLAAKHDFYWYPNAKHELRFGGIAYQHRFTPNRLRIFRDNYSINSDVDSVFDETFLTYELALYAEDHWQLSPRWQLEWGLRWSAYQAEGRWWNMPEPRLKLGFEANPTHYLEASYTQMAQYIHQISNSGLALPIDVWIPSTPQIVPQRSQQATLSWQQKYPEHGLSILIETYYKTMNNLVGYREGGSFFDLDLYNIRPERLDWQNLVTQGDGTAYGVETQVDYQVGAHQAMLSYAWSRTTYTFAELNGGRPFAPRFDRRHMLSLLYQRKVNARLELSLGWFFSTGNPLPLPESQIYLAGHVPEVRRGLFEPTVQAYPVYSDLDEYRTQLYHRLDASLKIKPKAKERRWPWTFYWEVGAYNVYNRLNPSYFETRVEPNATMDRGTLRVRQYSLLIFTPSVSFNFSF